MLYKTNTFISLRGFISFILGLVILAISFQQISSYSPVSANNYPVARYYVKTNGNNSLDGQSEANAWKTIDYAVDRNFSTDLSSGKSVEICVDNGTYREFVMPASNGLAVLPVSSGISVSSSTVTFPSTVNLTSVVVGDYLFLYRSMQRSSGVYRISSVNNSTKKVTVENKVFPSELGSQGNFYSLSASIGRPIVVRNCKGGEVKLDLAGVSCDALKLTNKQYFIFDGINIANADEYACGSTPQGGTGISLRNADHNAFLNLSVVKSDKVGIKINESSGNGSSYNFFINVNAIDNGQGGSVGEGYYIGYDPDSYNCNTINAQQGNNYNHIISNKIANTGTNYLPSENAIDIKGGCSSTRSNVGTVIDGVEVNGLFSSYGNGIIFVSDYSYGTWVLNSKVLNTRTNPNDTRAMYASGIEVKSNNRNVLIYNNVIAGHQLLRSDHVFYGMRFDGSNNISGEGVSVFNNTIHDTSKGVYFMNFSGASNPGKFYNNIISSPKASTYPFFRVEGTGNWDLKSNLYTSDPTNSGSQFKYPGNETGRVVNSQPKFENSGAKNFKLQVGSPAIDKGFDVSALLSFDAKGSLRKSGSAVDIGSDEYVVTPTPTPTPTPTLTPTPTPSPSPTPTPITSRSYFIDSINGNDTNTGTSSLPWKSLDKLNSTKLNPGDKIYLRKGSVFTVPLTGWVGIYLKDSGTSSNPIIIESYGSGTSADYPIIQVPGVQKDATGYWVYPLNIQASHYKISELRLRSIPDNNSSTNVDAGIRLGHTATGRVYKAENIQISKVYFEGVAREINYSNSANISYTPAQ